MSAANDSLAASVRAYLDRDWGLFERLRDRELVSQRRHGTLPTALHIMQQLRDSARTLRPEWPTEADREADLEDHRRLAATLARTASFQRSAKPSAPGLRPR